MIDSEDLIISLENMMHALKTANVKTVLEWKEAAGFSSDFSIFVFDTLENILEYEEYMIDEILVRICPDGARFEIIKPEGNPNKAAFQIASDRYPSEIAGTSQGYILDLFEFANGGGTNVNAHR